MLTFVNGKRIVGRVRKIKNRNVFITIRRRDNIGKDSKFAIDETILRDLKEMGVKDILIICETKDGDKLLWSSIYDWFRYGQKVKDVDTGRSKILCPVKVMKVEA